MREPALCGWTDAQKVCVLSGVRNLWRQNTAGGVAFPEIALQ